MSADNWFKATGTVRVQIGDPMPTTKIFLTPNTEYSVSHEGIRYVALFPCKGGGHEGKVIQYEPNKGLPITVQDNLPDLMKAAVQQTAVQVEIERDSNSGWTLRKITIPAPGKAK